MIDRSRWTMRSPSKDFKMVDHALRYATKEWAVFPCRVQDDEVGPAKSPLTEHGFKDATTDPGQIRKWWSRWPEAAIGTPTGHEFWVLDVDLPDGPTTLEALEAEHGPLPETLRQRTGGGGVQYFFRMNGARIRNSSRKIGPGIDVRGMGGYVILPPSKHPSGGRYEWIR